jgi:hypothetical protein
MQLNLYCCQTGECNNSTENEYVASFIKLMQRVGRGSYYTWSKEWRVTKSDACPGYKHVLLRLGDFLEGKKLY